jgi:hypothetical protein
MLNARRWNRLLWTVCVLVATIPALSGTAQPADPSADRVASPAITSEQPTARFLPSIRIRKLHLVRPDLIPYPIAYEIVC